MPSELSDVAFRAFRAHALTQRQYTAWYFCHVQGWEQSAAADAMGCTRKAVEHLVHHAVCNIQAAEAAERSHGTIDAVRTRISIERNGDVEAVQDTVVRDVLQRLGRKALLLLAE